MSALLLGAAVGGGLWLAARGLWPPRPSLAELFAVLDRPLAGPARLPARGAGKVAARGFGARLGSPLARALGGRADRLVPEAARPDLALIGETPQQYLSEVVGLAVLGVLLTSATFALLAREGVAVTAPWVAAVAVAVAALARPLVGAALGQRAARRREEFRAALSGYIDLVWLAVQAGSAVDEALHVKAQASDGWAFRLLHATLASAAARREETWTALARLGAELRIRELSELAGNVELATRSGGQVLRTLAAKADALRAQRLSAARSRAHRVTQRVNLPLALMGCGFLLFILYAPMRAIFGHP